MKQALYQPLPRWVKVNGRLYRLRPSFDRVLRVFALYEDPGIFDMDKVNMALSILVWGKCHNRLDVLTEVFGVLMAKNREEGVRERSFDFLQDSALIYAAFQQAYGMNLFQQHGKLHWWEFLALFSGLPENTRLMQVIQIRQQPLPKPNKYNREEIQQLLRLKAQYRLEISDEERQRQFSAGLAKLAQSLLATAESGGEE